MKSYSCIKKDGNILVKTPNHRNYTLEPELKISAKEELRSSADRRGHAGRTLGHLKDPAG